MATGEKDLDIKLYLFRKLLTLIGLIKNSFVYLVFIEIIIHNNNVTGVLSNVFHIKCVEKNI